MMIKDIFRGHSRSFIIVPGLLLVIIIGIFDYLSGPEFSSLIAYFIPIIFVTRFAGRTAGVILSVTSATTWIIAEILYNPDYIFFPVHFWNLLEKLGIFLIVVFILQKLAKIEDERNNLLSMLAHDMKNPALVAKGFSERLLKGKAGSLTKRQEEYARLINHELSRLERLIMDFLDISKFQSRKFKLNSIPFDILLKIKNHIEVLRIEAENKNISLLLEFPEVSMIQVHADVTQIDRVISNLVGNAINYSSRGGNVTIKLSAQNRDVLVQVQDTGKGISKEHIRHVFKPFYRITNDHSGSGLGLPIAKSIIEAHGGRLWVESKPGQGSTFSFTLPLNHTGLNKI
jgi:signal transduction histidine kinase